jgi:hypothetical protein
MTHGCSPACSRTFLLLCALVFGAASCIPKVRRSNADGDPGGGGGAGGTLVIGGGGSGGASEASGSGSGGPEDGGSGSGGVTGNGGTGSDAGSGIGSSGGSGGGAGGPRGGNGSGGAGSSSTALGSGGAGRGGTTGTGGSPPADIRCTADADCAASGQVCEPATKFCVPCVKTGDCPSGGHCLGNRCVTFTPCSSKADCSTDPVCDLTRGVCVQCLANSDCAAGYDCIGNQCAAAAICTLNSDCPTNVCDSANNRCIDCVGDSNCGSSYMRCLLNVCRTICTTNADCSALGMVCDTSVGACKQCLTSKDCPASWYCLVSVCVPDVCDATQSACNGTSVVACSADGDVFSEFTSCPTGKPCTVRGAVASCSGTTSRDGGVSDVPPATGDGGGGSCSGGTTADPCQSGIPKLTGTQTVDGNGGELCSLPYFVLNAQNAAKIINYNGVPTSQFETATARVAWDAAGLHAYVAVQDASVQTASMADSAQAVSKAYQGDSIELFFSSNNNVTGLTSKDTSTLHLILPANGPAVSVKDTGSAGTPTALPAGQYAQATTGTGYAIEVSIPWPGGAPTSGSAIRFDMAINSADKTFTGIDKMRDGQLIYYLGTVSGVTTCQSADGTVPWCDDRTWCQANVQ